MIGMYHLDNAPPCIAGQYIAPSIYRGVGGVARQTYAQGFDHASHGGRCAHGHAVAMAAVHTAFGFEEFSQFQGAGSHLLTHAPQASARA